MVICHVCGKPVDTSTATQMDGFSNIYECDPCWYTTGGETLSPEEV